jgi:small ligand-binding sensory domain FIST
MDGKPALDVFFDEVGDVLARDLERAAEFIGAALPVAGSDRRDFLVRNLVGADRERKLLAIGELVEKGQRIQFCRRDPASAEHDLRTMLGELKERLPGTPGGAVYYSCLGRGTHMFGPESRELKIIREELGDIPLSGFFCNGEISHNRLYGYTGVLTVFL